MTGHVEEGHALLPVTFRLDGEREVSIEFVVDTGFVGQLTLPTSAVEALGLAYQHTTYTNLADDSVVEMHVHAATILWQDEEIEVAVLATGRRPLLGMTLLEGSELVVQCRNGGLVIVDEM